MIVATVVSVVIAALQAVVVKLEATVRSIIVVSTYHYSGKVVRCWAFFSPEQVSHVLLWYGQVL